MHKHHRQRVKERFFSEGPGNFAPHELIEMLLFYGKPQGDTNPTAHLLMERFGSIKGILEASVDDLVQVNGVGEHTAALIKLIPELLRRCEKEMRTTARVYNKISKVLSYARSLFSMQREEQIYLMLLNNKMELLECTQVSSGTVNTCRVILRKIDERIFARNATYMILLHNHPNGVALPSKDDIEATYEIYQHVSQIEVAMLEHIIITDTRFCPMMKSSMNTYNPFLMDKSFLDEFYDLDEYFYRFPKSFRDKNETKKASTKKKSTKKTTERPRLRPLSVGQMEEFEQEDEE